MDDELFWFGGNEEPEFEAGMRFYSDGSIRHSTEEEADANRKRMRRFFFVQNQAKKQNTDPHEWRDRDGWRMFIRRSSTVIGVKGPDGMDYRDGFQAWITHPERAFRPPLTRYIRTKMVPYRGQAVADGLELLVQHRLRRRQRIAA